MFAEFNYNRYESNQIVDVKLNKNISNEQDFYLFLAEWLKLYNNEKDFIFIFNAKNVGFIPIKYSFKMSAFIKSLKKKPYQYLKKSIIIINNKFTKILLDIIFMIQPPVAPVYIIYKKNDNNNIEEIINDLLNSKKPNYNTDTVDLLEILPSKSFLNIL